MIELMVHERNNDERSAFAERLQHAIKEKGLQRHGLGASMARALGVTTKATNKYLHGEAKPTTEKMKKLAKFLGVSRVWLELGLGDMNPPEEDELTVVGTLKTWDEKTPLGEDEVEIPFFTDIELAAGSGSIPQQETQGSKLRFSKSSLHEYNVPLNEIACCRIRGNSMEPAIPDGATVGIDFTKKEIKDGDIYAIKQADELRIKVLYKLPGNKVRIRSFNMAEWPDETYGIDEITVLGRIFWWSVVR